MYHYLLSVQWIFPLDKLDVFPKNYSFMYAFC